MSRMKLKGKTAVIVGGGSGMGDVTARLFAEEGAAVVVADLDEQAAQAVARAIEDANSDTAVLARCVDVTVEAASRIWPVRSPTNWDLLTFWSTLLAWQCLPQWSNSVMTSGGR